MALKTLYGSGICFPDNVVALPARTVMDGIYPHRQNDSRYFYMTDLKDGFPNVSFDLTLNTLHSVLPANFSKERHHKLEEFMRQYAVTSLVDGLPLGAPLSPFLFNVHYLPVDNELIEYCCLRGIVYTRYLDDFSFSSRRPISQLQRRQIRQIIEELPGAQINHRKSKVHSLDSGPVTITGVSLYPDGHILPSPKTLQSIESVCNKVENFFKTGVVPDPLNNRHALRLYRLTGDDDEENPDISYRPGYMTQWLSTAQDILSGYIGAIDGVICSVDDSSTSRAARGRLRVLIRQLGAAEKNI
jgi:hypothetical protein